MKTLYYILSSLFILLSFNSCAQQQPKDEIPQHDSFSIVSKHVSETRVINVWLPENYQQSNDSLPVLYMADGGIKEDFPHIANTLAQLISAKQIPPIILVGIENTDRKRDLTGPTQNENDKKLVPKYGGSAKFSAFIHDELFTFINSKYRTKATKGIIGESLSGLFVMETFMLRPQMFDFYIAFDPSVWWNDRYLVTSMNQQLNNLDSEQQKVLWFASSNAKDIRPSAKEIASNLKTLNLSNLIWNYADEPKEKHHTIFRATKEKALIWTLNQQFSKCIVLK